MTNAEICSGTRPGCVRLVAAMDGANECDEHRAGPKPVSYQRPALDRQLDDKWVTGFGRNASAVDHN